jgi:hypothetical protein
MSFYKNAAGVTAKLMRGAACVIVMTEYRTLFFNTEAAAGDFLKARGFYKRG